MNHCVVHTVWAPEGRKGRSQAGQKSHQLEVGGRRARKLLVTYISIFYFHAIAKWDKEILHQGNRFHCCVGSRNHHIQRCSHEATFSAVQGSVVKDCYGQKSRNHSITNATFCLPQPKQVNMGLKTIFGSSNIYLDQVLANKIFLMIKINC